MVMFTRYRALPDAELNRILAYVKSGKPIVGFRTSTHAFNYPAGSPHIDLNDGFGRDVFGQKWITHHGHRSTTTVALRAEAGSHPILRGVTPFAAVVAVSRDAAEGAGDAAARRKQRQLGQDGQGGPVPARAAGRLDA